EPQIDREGEEANSSEQWSSIGKGRTGPGEPLLVHGASTFLRFRCLDPEDATWTAPMERTGNMPIALLDLKSASRTEIWPDEKHTGLPVLLPGGEVGRLLRFEHS